MHFARHPGHGDDDGASEQPPDARSGPLLVRNRLTTSGKKGLHSVTLCHLSVAVMKQFADELQGRFMHLERYSAQLGQDVTGQIVLRRSQPASADDKRSTLAGDVKDTAIVVEVICHCRVEMHGDAQFCEALAEPLT